MFDTKLQVPISSEVLKIAQKRAKEYGFSSVNEIVRFMLNQFNKGSLGISVTHEDDFIVSDKFATMLKDETELEYNSFKKGIGKTYDRASDLIDDLEKELTDEKSKKK